MSRPGEFAADSFVAAAGTGLHLLRQQRPGGSGGAANAGPLQFGEVLVTHDRRVLTAKWNRNNKVVAAGCDDGRIQLLYANGQVMCVLPRPADDSTAAPLPGAVTSLSWSGGSRRLAAGTTSGVVYIFDMRNEYPMVELGGHLGGVLAVEYQHDDKVLAVASGDGSIVCYADPNGAATTMPLLPSAADGSARRCLSMAAGEPVLAAGSVHGSVAVWDMASRRVREEYAGQHGGAPVSAVAFVPLRPGWLYSAGEDGNVVLQDRQAGPGYVSAFNVGAPVTSFMVKEDHSLLGVGTSEGVVLLYDPRRTQQPLHTLAFAGRQPIHALHWQHNYASLVSSSSRLGRTSSSAASTGGAGPSRSTVGPSRLGMPPSGSTAAMAAAAAGASSIGSRIAPASAAAAAAPASAAAAGRPGAAPTGLARRTSLSAPTSRAASPGTLADASVGAAPQQPPQQPRSLSSHAQLAQPAPPNSRAAATPQQQQQQRPVAAPAPAITPLPGMAGRYGSGAGSSAAPAAGEVTPPQQRLQQLSITPLGGTAAAVGQQQRPQWRQQSQSPPGDDSPLQPAAGAPMADLGITPLAPPPLGRQPLALPRARELPPAAEQQQQHVAPLPLDITPLPARRGGSAEPSGSGGQRSVLGERQQAHGGGGATGGRSMMLPRLALQLPSADEELPTTLQASASFAENMPSPAGGAALPPPGCCVQQHDAATAATAAAAAMSSQDPSSLAEHKEKAAAAAGLLRAESRLFPTASGDMTAWRIGTARAGANGEAAAAAAASHGQQQGAAAAAGAGGGPYEFSFVAAHQSLEQLQRGASMRSVGSMGSMVSDVGPLVAAGSDTVAAAMAGGAAAAAAAPQYGLRDDILALHLDMLQQFQAQQQCMGELVARVVERNEVLTNEVAALRKQLAALTGRRNEFLWL